MARGKGGRKAEREGGREERKEKNEVMGIEGKGEDKEEGREKGHAYLEEGPVEGLVLWEEHKLIFKLGPFLDVPVSHELVPEGEAWREGGREGGREEGREAERERCRQMKTFNEGGGIAKKGREGLREGKEERHVPRTFFK